MAVPEGVFFSQHELSTVFENRRQRAKQVIDRIGEDELIVTADDVIVEKLFRDFSVDAPELEREKIDHEAESATLDARYFSNFHRGRSGPIPIDGTLVTIRVPYKGDAEFFHVWPNLHGPTKPIGRLGEGGLLFEIAHPNLTGELVTREMTQILSQFETYLTAIRNECAGFNGGLRDELRSHAQMRRQRILGVRKLSKSLPNPLRRREAVPAAFQFPLVRKQLVPAPREAAGAARFEPEPVLSDQQYEEVLGVLSSMSLVMERCPASLRDADESMIRTLFLVSLNAVFQGAATGETFNYTGKTDILIRHQDKNLFIAECKFWSGAQSFQDAISQLLGYAHWRDCRLTMLVFSRNKNFSDVLSKMREAAKQHPAFRREIANTGETGIRFVAAHPHDAARELTVTALAFDVPSDPRPIPPEHSEKR